MAQRLPDLSRFEMQCLRRLWTLGEASARDVHGSLSRPPSYSTVRTILERLAKKGAVERVRLENRAWIYRSRVSAAAMIAREIRRLVDGLFDGSGEALVAHLADMDAITLEDLRVAEERLAARERLVSTERNARDSTRKSKGAARRRDPSSGRGARRRP